MIVLSRFTHLLFGPMFVFAGGLLIWLREPVGLVVFGVVLLLVGLYSLWQSYLGFRAGLPWFEPETTDPLAKGSCRRCAGSGWVRGRVNGERCACVQKIDF
ncbi:hypothetical protein M8C17_09875 [Micromonospora sp. RHAY321]|uniref:hypothetical protein n=1 Tax=Micromonospora sp. RHAY321 TaxID=2944807 RepID=UPI00207C2C99|nr:hypothetical protein [Micromonospora sp. RHAY321]MCO1595473.1 hypothetical protein [Micromonospora sp. RHAY321]